MTANIDFYATCLGSKFSLSISFEPQVTVFRVLKLRDKRKNEVSVSIDNKFKFSLYQAFSTKPYYNVKFIGIDQVSYLLIRFRNNGDGKIGGIYQISLYRSALDGLFKKTLSVSINELQTIELREKMEASGIEPPIQNDDVWVLNGDEIVERVQVIKNRSKARTDFKTLADEIYAELVLKNPKYRKFRPKTPEHRWIWNGVEMVLNGLNGEENE